MYIGPPMEPINPPPSKSRVAPGMAALLAAYSGQKYNRQTNPSAVKSNPKNK